LPRRDKRWDENTESPRIYRGQKIKKGRGSIYTKRDPYQPKGSVIYSAKKIDLPVKSEVKGTFNKVFWVRLTPNGKTINSKVENVVLYNYGKGYRFL